MELGLREILVLIGVIVVAAILLDGYRRMRRNRLRMDLMKAPPGSEEGLEGFTSELPNGGARVVSMHHSLHDLEQDGPDDTRFDAPFGSAQQGDEGRDEVLGSAHAHENAGRNESPGERRQPGTGGRTQSDLFADDDILLAARADQQARLNRATRGKGRPPASAAVEGRPQESVAREPYTQEHRDQPEARATQANRKGQDVELSAPDIHEVLIINVMSRQGEFSGSELNRVLQSCGFRFGEMNIFHRYEQHSGKGAMLFSAANVVEPGTFDPDNMDHFSTPGICMFMQLPGPKRPMHAFEIMMDSARKIANLLEADIKDEHHNVLRQQTAEHYRQRVLDFERKMLTLQGGQRQH